MIKSTTKKTTEKKISKKVAKANPRSWTRYADLRPKGGGCESSTSKPSEQKSMEDYYAKLYKLAEDIQWEKRNEYPIHGYPHWRAVEDATYILAKKKQNPSKKCRTIKVRRKISMGKGKRPRILQVRRKVCNPETEFGLEDTKEKLEYLWLNHSIIQIKASGKKDFKGLIKPAQDYINWFKVYNYYDDEFNVIWIKLNDVLEINGDTIKVSSYRTSTYPPISDRR